MISKWKKIEKKLKSLKVDNEKKVDKIKALKIKLLEKKQGKINLIPFVKNTLKKYNKPKPKKKKITDLIKFPEINLI